MSGPSRPPADWLVNTALAVVAGTTVLAWLLQLAGHLAASLTGGQRPSTGTAGAWAVLWHPLAPGVPLGAPGLDPFVYWGVVAVLVGVLVGTATVLVRAGRRVVRGSVHRLVGTATGGEVARAASARAVRRRGRQLRPSLIRPSVGQVGYLLGRSRGRQVWATVEDSILLLGPPRSGKGLHLVINAILDAPGPVVATSTRPDNLTTTLDARQRAGPVAVFDPQGLAQGVPHGLRWSPVRGCHDPLTAMIRAAGLAAGTGLTAGSVDNGGFWEGKTRTAVQALLHAAALDDRPPAVLYQWALNPAAAADATRILRTSSGAADGWADSLEGMISADPRTRDSIWHGVALAFAALADPRVLAAVTPTGNDAFDPADFLTDNGTLYLLATGSGAGASAPLVAALIEDLVETARRTAATNPGSRLDPPLLLALDEIGNLAPLPSLPTLMAEGGGTGITTMPVLQSMAQARSRWGDHAATAIWDASIVKIVLGGASNSRDLQDLTTLIGDHDQPVWTTTTDSHGQTSTQRSTRRQPILPPDQIRTLPFGTGLVLLRAAPPIPTRLRPWTSRPDAARLTSDRDQLQHRLQHAARAARHTC